MQSEQSAATLIEELSPDDCDAVGGGTIAYDIGHWAGSSLREAFASGMTRLINYQFQQVYK